MRNKIITAAILAAIFSSTAAQAACHIPGSTPGMQSIQGNRSSSSTIFNLINTNPFRVVSAFGAKEKVETLMVDDATAIKAINNIPVTYDDLTSWVFVQGYDTGTEYLESQFKQDVAQSMHLPGDRLTGYSEEFGQIDSVIQEQFTSKRTGAHGIVSIISFGQTKVAVAEILFHNKEMKPFTVSAGEIIKNGDAKFAIRLAKAKAEGALIK